MMNHGPNYCRDCGTSLIRLRILPGPRCATCWATNITDTARREERPQHPDLTGQPDEIIDAIFDRILRDEGKWQIVDAAERAHKRLEANV